MSLPPDREGGQSFSSPRARSPPTRKLEQNSISHSETPGKQPARLWGDWPPEGRLAGSAVQSPRTSSVAPHNAKPRPRAAVPCLGVPVPGKLRSGARGTPRPAPHSLSRRQKHPKRPPTDGPCTKWGPPRNAYAAPCGPPRGLGAQPATAPHTPSSPRPPRSPLDWHPTERRKGRGHTALPAAQLRPTAASFPGRRVPSGGHIGNFRGLRGGNGNWVDPKVKSQRPGAA